MAALIRGSRNLLPRWNKHVAPTFGPSRSMASKTPVGFIGLGNMGRPMAKNLLRNGYPVIATDVFPESRKELQDLGAQVFDTPADVAEKADRILTMLPSSPNVIEVYTGANGILKKVKKGTLLIDSSTIDPAVSREMAVAAEKMGAVFMDAPVSGGVGAASLAKLTFMVGGPKEEYQAAQELLTCMGANVVYCGAVGTGQAAKICNNMLLAIGMIGTAETMNLGIRYARRSLTSREEHSAVTQPGRSDTLSEWRILSDVCFVILNLIARFRCRGHFTFLLAQKVGTQPLPLCPICF
ncbi:3-hydroxyisobutyrate dehydrogenase, mitochondrial-like [Gadus macrocephalus]|uniref:3-hydroxyisobutyrate dehydrogenase, mitochondrial-like n=1 Tax=Gadus macrocephalus TaxID=80720 RepID=UPI0028CB496E|nr:3-hydroxyisobutyrate dehydrogenase, mitochondrial-like [Gadus macrocephalus]